MTGARQGVGQSDPFTLEHGRDVFPDRPTSDPYRAIKRDLSGASKPWGESARGMFPAIQLPEWQGAGLCAHDPDPDLWFSRPGTEEDALAQALCTYCPVRERCASFGADQTYGVWGGLSLETMPELPDNTDRVCRKGHAMVGDNVYCYRRLLKCKQCRRDRKRESRARGKA